jgi:hypothetical protein
MVRAQQHQPTPEERRRGGVRNPRPKEGSGSSPQAEALLQLQRLAGNRAVTSLLRPEAAPDTHAQRADLIQREVYSDESDADPIAQEIATKNYQPNFAAPLSKDKPMGYQVTVAAATQMPEYLRFAKARMKSTIRNKVRSYVRSVPGGSAFARAPKTSAQIKVKAAAAAANKAPGTDETDPAVKTIIDNSDAVGHSWIKLSTIGPNGPIQTYSFGFLPQMNTPHGPQQAVPGTVRNPDLEFEKESFTNSYLDTPVSDKAYMKALTKIGQLKAAPPQYMTIGYNCTQFAKDVARAAGATFPSKAGMMIPISDRGFMQRALSPNALYSKMQNEEGTEQTSPEREMLKQGGTDTGSGLRARPGLQLYDWSNSGPTIDVKDDEVVIPLPEKIYGVMHKVLYKGQELCVHGNDQAYSRHLKQQKPQPGDQFTLYFALDLTQPERAVKEKVRAGTPVKVVSFDGTHVTVEAGRNEASRTKGTCVLWDFWKAVAGLGP